MPQPKLIVPTVRQAFADAPAAAPHLTYHGGHLLTNVSVYSIFWGSGWQSRTAEVQTINSFLDFVVTSSLMDLLAEYSVTGQQIGHGTHIGSVTITNSNPGDGTTVSDDQIRTALRTWIQAHTIPAPTGNTLYFVYLPPGVSSTMGGSASCTGYCGYHNADGATFYAVEPYLDCSGCNFTGHDVDSNITKVTSHELCEAVTDPALNGWFDDSGGDEIGDICNSSADVHQLGGFYVQSEWSNAQGACALAPRPVHVGELWHTLRNADGSWAPNFGLVEGQERNDPGAFSAISCGGVGNQLQTIGLVSGQLWHTLRNADGSWAPNFGLVEGQEHNNPGAFNAISCAGSGSQLQMIGIVNGQLWHTLRNADGSWAPNFGLVEGQEHNNPGVFTAISCAGSGSQLQMIGIV
jgi:hypothetical protein